MDSIINHGVKPAWKFYTQPVVLICSAILKFFCFYVVLLLVFCPESLPVYHATGLSHIVDTALTFYVAIVEHSSRAFDAGLYDFAVYCAPLLSAAVVVVGLLLVQFNSIVKYLGRALLVFGAPCLLISLYTHDVVTNGVLRGVSYLLRLVTDLFSILSNTHYTCSDRLMAHGHVGMKFLMVFLFATSVTESCFAALITTRRQSLKRD
jgi:hypothetical protein